MGSMEATGQEALAKIVGTELLPRSEVTKKIGAHIKKHKRRIHKINGKFWPMISYSLFLAGKRGVSNGQSGQQTSEIIGTVTTSRSPFAVAQEEGRNLR